MSYLDGFLLPLPNDNQAKYRDMVKGFARRMRELGAIGSLEGLGDQLQHGKTTDFYRAVKAQDGENVVFSCIVWPSKEVRDSAWQRFIAEDQTEEMPFDPQRFMWGGFQLILNTLTDGKD